MHRQLADCGFSPALQFRGLVFGLIVVGAVQIPFTMLSVFGHRQFAVCRFSPALQLRAYLEEKHLLQDVDLMQTVDGVTVTLEKVYADANHILVGYSVSGLPDPPFHFEATLTDERGTVFREVTSAGVTGTSDLLKVTLPEGDGSYLVAFDGSAVEGTPATLQLRLVMQLSRWIPVTPEAEPSTVDGLPVEPPAAMQASVPVMYEKGSTVGPFAFDLSVPFLPARVAEVQQTAHASGVDVRLERVIVTPSETRAVLCFTPPASELDWTAVGSLHTGLGRDYELTYEVRDRVEQADGQLCYVFGLLAPLNEQRGAWTLKVTELVGFEMKEPYGQNRLAGPWVFRFRVP